MALTNAQVFEHMGRMIAHGLQSGALDLEWFETLIPVGKDYRDNGAFGTTADRREAMRETLRGAWKITKGDDPDTDSAAEHDLRTHYIPGALRHESHDPTEEDEW